MLAIVTEKTKKILNDKFLKVLLDLPFGLLILNLDGVILKTNNKFRQSFSCKSKRNLEGDNFESIISDSAKEKFIILKQKLSAQKPAENNFQNQILEIVDEKKKTWSIELGIYFSDVINDHFLIGVLANESKIFNQQKTLKRQIELKNKLKDKLEQETELNEMKSRFLSIASHEFRTPLAGILSSLNLINRYFLADEQSWKKHKYKGKIANHIKKIDESIKNLTTILNKFLSMGNIEKGEIIVKYSKINLVKLFGDQVVQFQLLTKPGQIITFNHKGQYEHVFQDKHLLKNIMNNLLSNAIKFSPENTNIHLISETSDSEIRIIIKDQGIGIPVADQKRIFHRFFRAKNALTSQEGTGLGLSIVKKYTEMMGGKINFVSEENIGTTFTIKLPNKRQ